MYKKTQENLGNNKLFWHRIEEEANKIRKQYRITIVKAIWN